METANGEVEDEGTDDTEMEGATRKLYKNLRKY